MMTVEAARQFYAEEIRTVANLQSESLVRALASVPREAFLGPGPWDIATADPRRPGAVIYRKTADANPLHVYHNVLIAIDASRELNNGQPATLASILDALSLSEGETFFHVGCGTGYYTALGATIVGHKGRTVAVDIDERLAERAAENLHLLPHVTVLAADATTCDPGPCDAILVNAGFTHPLSIWLDRLSDRGRLILPITASLPDSPVSVGALLLVTREQDRFHGRPLAPIAIFASPTGRNDDLNPVIRQALTTRQWFRIRRVRRDSHEQGDACCVHSEGVCLSHD